MENPSLNNKNEYPSDEVLSRELGKVKGAWDLFIAFLKESHPSFCGEWRYYNDGKKWLYKITKKKNTICWASVWPGLFKTGFYFSDKAEDLIKASKLKKEYVEQFIHGKRYGKIKGIAVEIRKPTDLNATKILIEIKEQFK